MTIPTEFKTAGQKLEPVRGQWLWLIDFFPNASQTIRVCSGSQNRTFGGETYYAFPITVSGREENADGNLGEISLTADNSTAFFDDIMLDQSEGLTDKELILYGGYSEDLSDTALFLRQTLYIASSNINRQSASFGLTAAPLFDQAIPSARFERDYCANAYRDAYCRYRGQSAAIASASNATPVVVTTSAAHGFKNGATAVISGVSGSSTANGTFTITVLSATTFSLGGTSAGGAGTGGTAFVDLPTCDFTRFGANGCLAHDNTDNFFAAPGMLRQP